MLVDAFFSNTAGIPCASKYAGIVVQLAEKNLAGYRSGLTMTFALTISHASKRLRTRYDTIAHIMRSLVSGVVRVRMHPIASHFRFAIAFLALVPSLGKSESPDGFQTDAAGYGEILVPFLTQHCIRCHGPEDQQADLRVDQNLPNDFLDVVAKGKWGEVVNVLNSHEMPPEDEPQPKPEEVGRIVDWITQQMVRAELHRRDSAIVVRRMNRAEYRNTIRDLIGIDFDTNAFPQDPPTGGFDNNGGALTVSPLHLELYYNAARKILDQALVEGDQPPSLKWRFEPESGDSDSNRVVYDGQRVIVNGGKSRVEGDFKVMHHESWDRNLNARDFALPHEGDYVIRIRAGGTVPNRDEVVQSAEKFLRDRMQRELEKNPERERWVRPQYENDLEHFRTDRMYTYGPPRLKLTLNLGGQPRVLTEFDVPAKADAPDIYEVPCRFTTQKAGITIDYAYSIPRELENFWFQTGDDFARPELWVDWFEIEGPLYDTWPPESHANILFESVLRDEDERAYAREVLARFMQRAYRRPVTVQEVDEKLALYDDVREDASSFVQAIKTPLSAVLVSPNFLYLAEPGSGTPPPEWHVFTDTHGRNLRAKVLAVADANVTVEREDGRQFTVPVNRFSAADQAFVRDSVGMSRDSSRQLDEYQLASRLSYFLWSSMPDEELFQLAERRQLANNETLAIQVERMLADPKSEALVDNFAGQWLGLREVGANPPAADLYPRYDRHLELSIVEESKAFFREILQNDLSVMNFVRSDFVVINERLGRYYGISGVTGDHFRRVLVPKDAHRGGIVTQASILSTTSNGTRTSPVKRGTWIMKNVLGIDPGLPVANAGEIAPKVPGIDKATVRQRLEIHRELPQCARCHNKIDPLGFALENFNAAGEWRDREGFGYKGRIGRDDPVIDASSKLLDGTEVIGVDGLREALMDRRELFLNCLAGKMLTYALGRELGVADAVHVDAAVRYLNGNGDTLKSLVTFIVTSEPFGRK
ncbi:MAG: DUF1592 domain-containing protein [Planctomycetaceae bacterium]|nr:DUF1592 domain-containing protein [Planctomycetaceae bacterium]